MKTDTTDSRKKVAFVLCAHRPTDEVVEGRLLQTINRMHEKVSVQLLRPVSFPDYCAAVGHYDLQATRMAAEQYNWQAVAQRYPDFISSFL